MRNTPEAAEVHNIEKILAPQQSTFAVPSNAVLPSRTSQYKDEKQSKLNSFEKSIYSMWEFAAVSQFFQLFQTQLGLSNFNTQDLLDFFLTRKGYLYDLQVRMYRVGTKNRFIMNDTWLQYIDREIQRGLLDVVIGELPYEEIGLYERVKIFLFICELQLDRSETFKMLDIPESEAVSFRVDSIGQLY
jgi:hypothetical protein